MAAAETAVIDETESHTRARLWTLSTEKSLGQALALSSPELFAQRTGTGWDPPHGLAATKAEKSLLRYLIRAALKTSPFSTFMHVAPLEISLNGASPVLEGREAKPVNIVTLNRGTLARIYRETSIRSPNQESARFQINTTIRDLGDGRLEALVGQYVVLRGRSWRQSGFRVSAFTRRWRRSCCSLRPVALDRAGPAICSSRFG